MGGVDRAAALLRRAQAKACTPQGRLTWVRGNLAFLPLASQSFKGARPSWPWILSRPAPRFSGNRTGGCAPRFRGSHLGTLIPGAAAFLAAATPKQAA